MIMDYVSRVSTLAKGYSFALVFIFWSRRNRKGTGHGKFCFCTTTFLCFVFWQEGGKNLNYWLCEYKMGAFNIEKCKVERIENEARKDFFMTRLVHIDFPAKEKDEQKIERNAPSW